MRRLKESTTIFYSTHILDDVQQVSDEVAILKDGRRVLQSSMPDLLTQDEGTFVLTLTGDVEEAIAAVRSQRWVTDVAELPQGAEITVAVRVSDEAAAQQELLRVVLRNDGVQVVEFGRRRSELEDVFIDVVEGTR